MSKTTAEHPPGAAGSAEQRARRNRILRAATRMAAKDGFDGVQMHDIARESGVAIATLYRYFPSKVHLYSAVMHSLVENVTRNSPPVDTSKTPAERVATYLHEATLSLVARPRLADALTRADISADSLGTDLALQRQLLRLAGVNEPTAQDLQISSLVVRCWYGILVVHLNGRSTQAEAIDELNLACRLLLAGLSATASPSAGAIQQGVTAAS